MECFADQKVAPQQPSLNLQHRAPVLAPTFSSAKWSALQTKRLHLMPTTKTEPAMQSQVSTPTFLSAKWSVLQIKRLHLNNQSWTSNTEHPCLLQPFHLQNGVLCRPKGCTSCQQPRQNLPCRVKCQPQSFYLQNRVFCRSKGCTSTIKLEPPTQSTHDCFNLFICKMEHFADQKVAPHANNQDWTCHAELSVNPNLLICKMECFADQKVAPQQPSLNLQHREPMPTPTFSSAKWSVLQTKRLHLMPTTKTEPAMQSQVSTPTFYLQNGVFCRSKGCTSTTKLEPPTQSTHANPNLFICKMECFADQKVAPHANNQDWTCHAESSVNPNLFICKMECFADQKVAPQQPSLNLQHRAPMPTPTFSSAKWSVLQTKRLHLMPTTKTEPAMQSQVSTPTFLSAKWSVLQIKRLHLNNQAWTSNTEHPCQPQPFHLQNGVFCRPKGCTSCQQPRLNLPCRVKCQPQPFYLQNGVFCRSKGCTSTTKLEPPTQSTHANPNLFICKMECFADQKVAPHANNQDWTCHAESSVNPNLFICKMECFAD